MIQHYVFLLSSFVHQIIMEKSKKVASLSFCIPRPFPLNDGGDHILAVATVAPMDTPHIKPRTVPNCYGGYFPFRHRPNSPLVLLPQVAARSVGDVFFRRFPLFLNFAVHTGATDTSVNGKV